MIIGLTLAGNALSDAAPKTFTAPELQNTAIVQQYAAAEYEEYLTAFRLENAEQNGETHRTADQTAENAS